VGIGFWCETGGVNLNVTFPENDIGGESDFWRRLGLGTSGNAQQNEK
jgi:hypothetical protein